HRLFWGAVLRRRPADEPELRVSAISLHSVSVTLGGKCVVDEVDLEVARGEWVTLIGPNGAGKSTLLRAIAGLVPFDCAILLDGGEQQRVVLARALAQEAPLLLLDEPTTALDIGRQQQALELVAELRAHGPLTVLSAMHELTLALQYADRLALLSNGRLVAAGAPHEIATESLLAEHYGADVQVIENGEGPGAVVPRRSRKTAGCPR